MEQIKIAFQQCELDYLDAIEALQKECGMSGKEAEALVEAWDDCEIATFDAVSSPVTTESENGA